MDKKALTRQYKETRRPMGVFQVRNTVDGKVMIGVSVDLPAMLNRQQSQLRMGGHPNKECFSDEVAEYDSQGQARSASPLVTKSNF